MVEEKHFWEDEDFKKEHIKKMKRNKKAREKRRDKSAIAEYEKWAKSGYRTY